MVGLHDHMLYVRQLPTTSSWYTHNFDDMSDTERRFIIVTGLSSIATDKLMAALLKDDRVALQPAVFLDAFDSGIQDVLALPDLLFNRLSGFVAGYDGHQLRHEVVRATLQIRGDVDRKLFGVLRQLLYKFLAGNRAAKLDELASSTETPACEILAKAQRLAQIGFSRVNLLEAFDLIAQAPWTTLRAEQMHGAAAAQHKQHPLWGPATHSAKTGVMMLRPLVRAGLKTKTRSKLQVKLDGLLKKKPEKGKHGIGHFVGQAIVNKFDVVPEDPNGVDLKPVRSR